nr:MAG TPA: hypothetical protein [Caudoviricetes sp.]
MAIEVRGARVHNSQMSSYSLMDMIIHSGNDLLC